MVAEHYKTPPCGHIGLAIWPHCGVLYAATTWCFLPPLLPPSRHFVSRRPAVAWRPWGGGNTSAARFLLLVALSGPLEREIGCRRRTHCPLGNELAAANLAAWPTHVAVKPPSAFDRHVSAGGGGLGRVPPVWHSGRRHLADTMCRPRPPPAELHRCLARCNTLATDQSPSVIGRQCYALSGRGQPVAAEVPPGDLPPLVEGSRPPGGLIPATHVAAYCRLHSAAHTSCGCRSGGNNNRS